MAERFSSSADDDDTADNDDDDALQCSPSVRLSRYLMASPGVRDGSKTWCCQLVSVVPQGSWLMLAGASHMSDEE
jgi:hypothetical protein